MNGTAGSMDAEKIASLQQQPLNAQDNNTPQQDGTAGAPGGAADGSIQQGGSFQAGMGGSSIMGVDGVAAQLAMGSAVVGGGSLVLGGDNSTGNVNKKLFVKRSCTEAMLKVGFWG